MVDTLEMRTPKLKKWEKIRENRGKQASNNFSFYYIQFDFSLGILHHKTNSTYFVSPL